MNKLSNSRFPIHFFQSDFEQQFCREHRKPRRQFLPLSVHTDVKLTQQNILYLKSPKSNTPWLNRFLSAIPKVFLTLKHERTSNINLIGIRRNYLSLNVHLKKFEQGIQKKNIGCLLFVCSELQVQGLGSQLSSRMGESN